MKKNTHEVGKLTNKLGSIVEKIVLPGIVGKVNEKGFKFCSVSANVEFWDEKKKPVSYALENGFYVLQQPDVMAIRILDFPKGRSAKAW
ncbi:hypothetical protein R83H12_02595 [Fibrobacteria bacterium R8-3-H12]